VCRAENYWWKQCFAKLVTNPTRSTIIDHTPIQFVVELKSWGELRASQAPFFPFSLPGRSCFPGQHCNPGLEQLHHQRSVVTLGPITITLQAVDYLSFASTRTMLLLGLHHTTPHYNFVLRILCSFVSTTERTGEPGAYSLSRFPVPRFIFKISPSSEERRKVGLRVRRAFLGISLFEVAVGLSATVTDFVARPIDA